MIALVVALAGGIGAAARAWVDGVVAARRRGVWGIMVVNLSGSLLIGIVAGMGAALAAHSWQTIVSAGFLGGYTTFSTAAVQTAEMLTERRWAQALAHAAGLLIGAAACAAAGMWAGAALAAGFAAG